MPSHSNTLVLDEKLRAEVSAFAKSRQAGARRSGAKGRSTGSWQEDPSEQAMPSQPKFSHPFVTCFAGFSRTSNPPQVGCSHTLSHTKSKVRLKLATRGRLPQREPPSLGVQSRRQQPPLSGCRCRPTALPPDLRMPRPQHFLLTQLSMTQWPNMTNDLPHSFFPACEALAGFSKGGERLRGASAQIPANICGICCLSCNSAKSIVNLGHLGIRSRAPVADTLAFREG